MSYTLNKNLEYENQRRLANDKFHRYTSLHFRSFIMSNIAYSDYIDSKKVRDEISNLLVAIGKGEVRVSPHDKKELYNIKDVCVKTTIQYNLNTNLLCQFLLFTSIFLIHS